MYDVCIKRQLPKQYGRALRASQTKMRGTKLFLGFKLKRKAEGAKYKTVFFGWLFPIDSLSVLFASPMRFTQIN